jgi:hypothetical protein
MFMGFHYQNTKIELQTVLEPSQTAQTCRLVWLYNQVAKANHFYLEKDNGLKQTDTCNMIVCQPVGLHISINASATKYELH